MAKKRINATRKTTCTLEEFLSVANVIPDVSECEIVAEMRRKLPKMSPLEMRQAKQVIADHERDCDCPGIQRKDR